MTMQGSARDHLTFITSPLPEVSRVPFPSSGRNLLSLLLNAASSIWYSEDGTDSSPPNEQRAFRKSYTYPSEKGIPKNATIVVAADDYYVMFVDGVMAHQADPLHDWKNIEVFNVPIPVTKVADQEVPPGEELLLGFRVVNKRLPNDASFNVAGLIAVVQVNFDSGQTDVFYTGSDQTWLSERYISEGWEQPGFDALQQGRIWPPAVVVPAGGIGARQLMIPSNETIVLGQLFVNATSTVPDVEATKNAGPPERCSCDSTFDGVKMSAGAFAGVISGTVVCTLIFGGLLSILALKKRGRSRSVKLATIGPTKSNTDASGPNPAHIPETTPGRPLSLRAPSQPVGSRYQPVVKERVDLGPRPELPVGTSKGKSKADDPLPPAQPQPVTNSRVKIETAPAHSSEVLVLTIGGDWTPSDAQHISNSPSRRAPTSVNPSVE